MTTMRVRQVQQHESRSTRSSRVTVMSLVAASLAGLLGACGPDAEGKFDDFVEKTRESDGATSMFPTTEPATTEPATTEPATTTADTEDTADTEGPPPIDISGDFLMAVSTVVDKSKPLQFVATSTVTTVDGARTMAICLQPLTLTQGKVTVPRLPIGEPLCYADLPIAADGTFTIDAGEVKVTGEANPITGANIVATLLMAGTIQDADFYCGTVSGEVKEPPIGPIDGSTFAAVRLTDKTVLPTDVVINCAKMPTVTDAP